MECPHCGRRIVGPVDRLRARRKEAGQCIQCGLSLEDENFRHIRCKGCRGRVVELRNAKRNAARLIV